MTYRENPDITAMIDEWSMTQPAIYNFQTDDNVTQTVWVIDNDEVINKLMTLFTEVKAIYIADGHHRTAAAVKVGIEKRSSNANHTGFEGYNYFLSVIFPDTHLTILEYNRLIKNINGLSEEELLERIKENFEMVCIGKEAFIPQNKHFFGMYMGGNWYGLKAKPKSFDVNNPVDSLDVSILHNLLIAPIFGITDPRSDERIDFVGGVKGVKELERRVDSGEMRVAFVLYPTSIEDLMKISDSDCIMPPKSTWFEPKLQSGIFIHSMRD